MFLDHEDDRHRERFTNILDGFNLTQFVSNQIHQLGGVLDVVVTDPVHPPGDITVVDVGVYDHMLVPWTVDISSPSPKYITISRRSWKSFDINEFRNEIAKSEVCVSPGMDTNTGTDVDGLVNR